MSERMTPIPFEQLLTWMISEHEKGSVFGVRKPYKAPGKTLPLFNEKIETPFGPAAGPNTQLAQNIIAAYYAGCRFFELKTVQKMDGAELAACVPRPCILAADEGYNCEWSTELTIPNAFCEYVKAWVLIKYFSKKWKLGSPDGFSFNMSVGYDLAGIKTDKINTFIDGMRNAAQTQAFKSAIAALAARFPEDRAYIESISPVICTGVTVSTLHGCPPQEIESIASYLICEKHLNTFVKCNPTILGYDTARERLNAAGFDYVAFDEHHFNEDLQYKDAIPMFNRLIELAKNNGLEFGLKLSNTFPVDVKQNELPSEEMYMSGRALYLLTIEMAARISKEFEGKLRLSYSGGADASNVAELFSAGIWPITVATTILKPGGYQRATQIALTLENCDYEPFTSVSFKRVRALSDSATSEDYYKKPVKPLPERKIDKKVPLTDCFMAPCKHGCPIGQDAPEYIELCGKGLFLEALTLITEKNPLPFITGTICAHHCMDKCTRNFYEAPVNIRATKLIAAQGAYDELVALIKKPEPRTDKKVAIVGAGAAGISAAYFLAREGVPVTVFEREAKAGGIVRNVIPSFRIAHEAIDSDVSLATAYGAEFRFNTLAPDVNELKAMGYDYILLAFGAEKPGKLELAGNTINVIEFLKAIKRGEKIDAGKNIAIIGGGNSAMDAARAAKRIAGVERVSIVYRRTKKYMPADADELQLAIDEGVEFCELLSPKKQANGELVCAKMALGDLDASGRRRPVETDELVSVPADLVVYAVGEHPDDAAFARYGVIVDKNGKAEFNSQNGVYVAGDALRGPATVVEAIADAQKFANAVLGAQHEYNVPKEAVPNKAELYDKKSNLVGSARCGADRCVGCNTLCENCVSACPNRANVAVKVPGMDMEQVLHIDYMCNECGNCAIFCPYQSRPFKDKLTLFANAGDFKDSENQGFYLLGDERVMLRLNGAEREIDLSKPTDLDTALEKFILTVIKDYPYLF